MLSELELVVDNDREMVFRHRSWKGWVAVVLFAAGIIVMYALVFWSGGTPDLYSAYATFPLLAGLFTALAFALRKSEVRLNFVSGVYVISDGIGGRKTVRGRLSEIQSITLKERAVSKQNVYNRDVDQLVGTEWTLCLKLADPAKSVTLMQGTDERIAYSAMDKIAGRLKIPAADLTARRRPKSDPAPAVADAAVQIPEPLPAAEGAWPIRRRSGPSGDISVSGAPGRRLIVLPSIGLRSNEVILMVLAVACAGVGIILPNGLPAFDVDPSPVEKAVLRDGLCFVAAVGFFIAAGRCVSREFVREESDDLCFGCYLFGMPMESRRLPKLHIREIVVSDGPVSRLFDSERLGFLQFAFAEVGELTGDDVFVRSDRDVVRLGSVLDADDKEWLMEELSAWRRGP